MARAEQISAFENMLARMLPRQPQTSVYRYGQKIPPHNSRLDDHGPVWQTASFTLASLDVQNLRVSLQPDFHLLAIGAQASVTTNGGFRASLFDVVKQVRLSDRGIVLALWGGPAQVSSGHPNPGPQFLREPYPFTEPNSEIDINIRNLETQSNTVQIVLYGVARPDWILGGPLPPK